MHWIGLGFIALFSLGVYNLFLKLTSTKISSLNALPFIAIGVLLVSFLGLLFTKNFQEVISSNKQAILLAFLTGIFWGVGQIFYFWMFTKGAPFSIGLPFIVGGLAVIGMLIGMIFLKEPFSFTKVAGVIIIFFGLLVLIKT